MARRHSTGGVKAHGGHKAPKVKKPKPPKKAHQAKVKHHHDKLSKHYRGH